jgi:hypothetical protein
MLLEAQLMNARVGDAALNFKPFCENFENRRATLPIGRVLPKSSSLRNVTPI